MEKKFAFIGAGNMGGAVAEAVCKAVGGENVTIFDPSPMKCKALAERTGCRVAGSGTEAADVSNFIMICVKPYLVSGVLGQMSEALAKRGKTIVSIAAGVSIADISSFLTGAGAPEMPIVRLLPNTPVSIGKGVFAMACSGGVSEEAKELLIQSLSQGGEVVQMEESLIDKATAVFSCSPAFVYMFIESLADGGVMCGVPREMAQKLAAQAVLGSAAMVLESGKHPGMLKDEVCSPGGSTIVGVNTLEEGRFRASVISAVREAYEKTIKLGEK